MDQPKLIVGYVYLITNLVNGKKYVGCTKVSIKQRSWQHRSAATKGSSLALHAAIRKYGIENFRIEVIEEVVGCHDDLMIAEIQQVASHNSKSPLGYNLTAGGEGVDLSVPSVREKHRLGVRNFTSDPEWRKKHAEMARALPLNPEWRKAHEEGVRERTLSPEWRTAIAESNRRNAANPQVQQNKLEGARKRSANPTWRMAQFEGGRKRSADPSWVEAHALAMRSKIVTPGGQRRQIEALHRGHAVQQQKFLERDALRTPEERERLAKNREAVHRYQAKKKASKETTP